MFDESAHMHPYVANASSEGSRESAQILHYILNI